MKEKINYLFGNFIFFSRYGRKKLTERLLSFFIPATLFLFLPNLSQATHISGADMSYRWISGNTFELNLTLYRDCSGISAPNTVSINYKSVSCGYNLNVTLNRVPGTGQEITQHCNSSPTICSGGTSPGIQQYEFTGIVTLPAQCSDWVFGYSICCRNCAITTLSYTPNNCTGVPATYVEATLNNLLTPTNSSPVFTNIPVSFFCIGQPFHYNHGAYDADGDSLVYSFVTPRSAASTNVTFKPGYSASSPISSAPPITLSMNGDILMNPTAIEVGVMAILVKEYRNGVCIGSVVRDMEVWTYPCNNALPTASGINGGNNFTLTACPGKPISFTINSADIDAPQVVTMDWNFGIPGASFTSTTGSRPVGTFSWTPTLANARSQPYTFTVTVQDNNCPSNGFQTYSYSINVPELSVNVTATNSNCTTPGTGTAIALPSGDAPFQYLWSPGGATTSSINSLLAGNYSVVVTDANGCTFSSAANILSPTPVNASQFSSTNVSCNGLNNGSISIMASGGTGPYTYSWLPSGGMGASASGLSAGTYTVTVSDAHGCTRTVASTITQPPLLTATTLTTAVLCYGDANGSASVTPSGGTAGYLYSWSTGSTSSSISGRTAGTYSVVITDALGCSITRSVNITQPAAINVTLSSTPAYCGSSNGSASLSIAGGTGPFTYVWNPGGSSAPSITNLSAGAYSVTVTDANGCKKTNSTGVSNLNGPSINVLSTINVKCHGGNGGAASVSVNGGQPPFTYLWSPAGGNLPSASGLLAGNYIVTVKDGNNCNSSVAFQINEPPPILATISSSDPLCFGANSGSASVMANGGTPGYTYNWLPGNSNNPSVNNLAAGTYRVNITDANNCTASQSVTLSQPVALNASLASSSDVNCFGASNGSATITATGGSLPYSYSWFPSGDSLASAAGLSPGSYMITITDAHNCTKTLPLSINQPSSFISSISNFGNTLCSNDSSGYASVAAVGGTSPYTYAWVPLGESTPSVSRLPPGNYSVTATDARGCTTVSSITIIQPPPISISLIYSTDVSCFGGADGSASVSVTGGTPPYSYQWFPSGGTASFAYNLPPGNLVVAVTDANGCSDSLNIFIDQPLPLSAAITTISPGCNGGNDGSAAVIPSGGTGPYSYLWSPGGNTSIIATSLSAGNYNLLMKDSKGCVYSASVNISQPPPLNVYVSSTTSTCSNSNGSAHATADGGVGGYTYYWSPVNSIDTFITNVPAGAYRVIVEDSNGCTVSTTAGVSNIGGPSISLSSLSNVSCSGGNDGSASVSLSGGSGPFNYQWLPSGGNDSSASGLTAGNYSITITDVNNCISVYPVVITESTPLQISMNTTGVSCYGANDGSVSANVTGGTGTYIYSWNNNMGNFPSGNNLSFGNYTVTVTDQNGCSQSAQAVITHPDSISIVVNNITPVSCFGRNDGSASVIVNGGTAPYIYNWGTSGVTAPTITDLAAGNYSVTVTDALGCTTSSVAVINQPSTLSIQGSAIPGTCSKPNGSASVFATGGSSPYSFLWNQTGETTSSITGLPAGNYSVMVTDLNGCQVSSTVNVLNTGTVNANLSALTNVTCNGGNDGSATISVGTGYAPYSFTWQPSGGNSQFANGLVAGTYNVIITDANNCRQNIPVVINEPPALSATVIATHVKCAGAGNGMASVIAAGGTGAYAYRWLPGGLNTPVIGSLNGGNYSIEVTDIRGCTTSTNFTILEPSPVVLTATTTPAGCLLSNGSATVVASGGTSPYRYFWSPGGIPGNTAVGLQSGSYSVTVTDANNCISTLTTSVSNANGPNVSPGNIKHVSCYNGTDGSAEVIVSSGTSPFSFNWYPIGGNAPIARGLPAGSYSVTVRDSNNCFTSLPVTINQPVKLNAVITPAPATCFGRADGYASAVVSGGTQPYIYNWSSGDSSSTAFNLSRGNYTLTVIDYKGCNSSFNTDITEPPTMHLNLTTAPVNCYGRNDGMANLIATGGTPGYSYLWSNGYTYPYGTNFFAGSYSVTVTDAHGCQSDTVANITEPSEVVLSSTSTDVSCPHGADGHATIHAVGGIPPYTYLWLPSGGNSETAYNLPQATYDIVVNDFNGCIHKINVNIGAPRPVVLSVSETDTRCYGSNEGTATISATGGKSPYTYLWSNGCTNATATSLQAGTYNVVVTDSNFCSVTKTVTIDQPPQLDLVTQSTMPICIGQSASLSARCAGGTPGYSFIWSNGPHTSQQNVSPATTTTYTVNVTDSRGCTTDPQTVTVIVNQGLLAIATGPDTVCEGNAATISAHCTGGNGGPYTYHWDFGAVGEDVFISPFTNTIYTVTVTDGCGSPSVTATVPVIVIPNPNVNFIPNPSNGCQPLLVNFNDQSNTGAVEYYWNFGDGTSDTTRNPSHIFLDAGSYTVNHLVTTNNGCVGKITVPAAVNVYPNPIASFTNVPEVTSVYAPEISFFDQSTNAVSWEWDFGDNSNHFFNRNPDHTYQDTGIYEVKLITTSPNGCIDTAFGKVVIRGEFAFYIPNAFTPNNDGVNDNFMALGIGVKEFEMFVYDRWGLQIFYSQDLKSGWDGKVQGHDTPCQMDVYLYVVKIVDFIGRPHQYIGHVSLVR